MRAWQDAILLLACLAAAGCRTDPNIALLERENRQLEDAIYELQHCIDQYQAELEKCRKTNDTLQARLAEAADGLPPDRPRPTPDPAAPPPTPTRPAPPARRPPPPVSPDKLAPPKIEMPGIPLPEGLLPETFRAPDSPDGPAPSPAPMPDLKTSAPLLLPGAGQSTRSASADSTRIAAIGLCPDRTGGYSRDGRGGADGIRAVIEPRDADGRLCPAAGNLSVVVLDPAVQGEAARVARWDFTATEIAKAVFDDGIHLEMVWPQSPPVHDRLHLYVRYTTEDGRRLETDSPIDVALGSQRTADWEPALLPKTDTAEQAPAWLGTPAPAPRTATAAPAPAALQQPRQRQSATETRPAVQRPVWSPHRR